MAEIQFHLRETHTIGPDTRERIVSARLLPGLARRGISLAGMSEARAPFAFSRLAPLFGQVLVCLRGTGEVWEAGRWVTCAAGMAYLTPAAAPHAYRALGDGSMWEIGWLHCPSRPVATDRPADQRRAPSVPISAGGEPILTSVNPHPLELALEGMYDEYTAAAPDADILDDWAGLVYAQALRIARSAAEAEPDARLRGLWAVVRADLSRPWTAAGLAAELGLGDEQLRRLCHRDLARSPMRQVTHLRMRHAASLLASGAYTVEAAAVAVGYDNPFAFSTAFRRCMGAPPSSYHEPRRGAHGRPRPAEDRQT